MFDSLSSTREGQIHYSFQEKKGDSKSEVSDTPPGPEKNNQNIETKTLVSEYANEKTEILENSVDELTQNLLYTIENSNVSDEVKESLKKIVIDDFTSKAKAEVSNSTTQISEIANNDSAQPKINVLSPSENSQTQNIIKENNIISEPIPPAVPPQMESTENLSPFEKGKNRYEKMSVSIAEAKNKTSMMSKKIGSKITNFLNKGKTVGKNIISGVLAADEYMLSAHSASEKFIVNKYDQAEKYSKEVFGKIENKSKNAFWTMKLALQEASYERAERKNEKANAQVLELSLKRTKIVDKLNNLREQRGAVNI